MYAVIKTGGKQYKVKEGDVLYIEKLNLDVDATVEFTDVLLVSDENSNIKFGTPTVSGAKVVANVVAQVRGKKIIVFKYKAKKDYRRKNGHRQPYTKVEIKKIEA